MTDQPDGGFDDSQVLTPEQLAELLAGMPDLGDPELPELLDERQATPMIGFIDGPAVPVVAASTPRRPLVRSAGRSEDRRERERHPDRSPVAALDPDAAASLSWLFR